MTRSVQLADNVPPHTDDTIFEALSIILSQFSMRYCVHTIRIDNNIMYYYLNG